jgi:hypothetical protein
VCVCVPGAFSFVSWGRQGQTEKSVISGKVGESCRFSVPSIFLRGKYGWGAWGPCFGSFEDKRGEMIREHLDPSK